MSIASLPPAWTASQCTRAPYRRATSTTSRTGWITPVSLLASMTETISGARRASSRSSAGNSMRPSASTAMRAASGTAASTETCSIAETAVGPRVPRSA